MMWYDLIFFSAKYSFFLLTSKLDECALAFFFLHLYALWYKIYLNEIIIKIKKSIITIEFIWYWSGYNIYMSMFGKRIWYVNIMINKWICIVYACVFHVFSLLLLLFHLSLYYLAFIFRLFDMYTTAANVGNIHILDKLHTHLHTHDGHVIYTQNGRSSNWTTKKTNGHKSNNDDDLDIILYVLFDLFRVHLSVRVCACECECSCVFSLCAAIWAVSVCCALCVCVIFCLHFH